MRAPPESLMPMIGMRFFRARSITLMTFSAKTSPSDPLRLQAESGRAVDREDVELLERVAVDQARDALARGQLVLGVLTVERLRITVARLVLALPEQVQRVDLMFWL